MSYDATQQASRRAYTRLHVIKEARFSQAVALGLPIEDAEIECSCGVVVTSGTWDKHRGLTLDAQRHARRDE